MPTGHFTKNVPPLRMPPNDGGSDPSGIRYEGDVLTGKIGVEEAHARAATQMHKPYYHDPDLKK